MNDVIRWKKADELEKLIKKQKVTVEQAERELSELRRTVTDGVLTGIPYAYASPLAGNTTIEKLRVTELWLNDYVYLDATGFHSIVEKEK